MAQNTGSSQSIGNQTVRTNFNPSNSPIVGQLKQQTAALIDLCNGNLGESPQADHSWQQAMLAYELASMWATKAATTAQQTSQRQ